MGVVHNQPCIALTQTLLLSPSSTPTITLSAAQLILASALHAANLQSTEMNVSIVDPSCNEVLFARMNSAKITSIDVARSKAFTSAGHKAPTRKFSSYAGVTGPAFGLHVSNNCRFSIIPGGYPITDKNGVLYGAIGVSGGTPDQDEEVAKAGVEAFRLALEKGGGNKSKL
mmetsp:Transcript_19808/g.39620  ORF Transcript_19808/g.39620 Transcript_19808/m.39620 type:complete len:171 (+) Transcript_19808:30-542(+)